jgi:hypothetical protein
MYRQYEPTAPMGTEQTVIVSRYTPLKRILAPRLA